MKYRQALALSLGEHTTHLGLRCGGLAPSIKSKKMPPLFKRWQLCLVYSLALMSVFILMRIAYGLGYKTAKAKKFVEIGTVDTLVQDAVNRTLIKIERTDEVNVADIERYVAIINKGEATLINLDRYL